MITRKDLIEKYLGFFKSKNHKIIPSSSLVPENDSSVLFTTAGMHPLVPYLLGQLHPLGRRLANVQKCIRTTDIDSVGDATHHTFFEMLGNWSLGDYWKKESIKYSYELLTKILGIPKRKLEITCFAGDKNAPKDTESEKAWKFLGVKKIKFLGKEDNWWGPAGQTGPCGPDTEIFINGVEIWNNVFMQYEKTKDGKFIPLKQKNVDTGMGVERTLAILNGLKDNYLTSSFLPIIKEIESVSGKKYKGNEKAMRIVSDHIKTAVMIIAENIVPDNIGRGYVARRLIRRAIVYGKKLNLVSFTSKLAKPIFSIYEKDYPELSKNKNLILSSMNEEESRFAKTLESGIREFEKLAKLSKTLSGKDAFLLYQSYGFPIELIEELSNEKNIKISRKDFDNEYKKHQDLSRASSAGTFKSGLSDRGEQTTKLHTATHLLNEALRQVLGQEVKQRGSNITPERLRFDFSFSRKLTEQEIAKAESLVNEKIQSSLEVIREEMPLKKALKEGAQAEFGHKYPEKVSVYTIKESKSGKLFSREICTGPHVANTKEIGRFKIIKEESVSAGVRRVKAIVT